MKYFTICDLPEGSQSLKSYLANNCTKTRDKHIGNNLYAVYDKNNAIKHIEARIKQYKDNNRMKQHFKMWENHIFILKGLK